MRYNQSKHHRRSIRLTDYDYSQTGAYFITICTYNRLCILGEAENGEIRLNKYGAIANECWKLVLHHFPYVRIDKYAVMPNHIHAIIIFTDNRKGGETVPLQKPTLGQIVAYYKYQTTKSVNKIRNTPGKHLWQRNYYEHVIRDENDFSEIKEYIIG